MYHLEALEFFKVLELLKGFVESEVGRLLVDGIRPTSSVDAIKRWFTQVEEAARFLDEGGSISFSELLDISPLVEVARLEGAVLSPEKLLAVKSQILLARTVREKLGGEGGVLASMARRLSPLDEVVEAIDSALDSSGEVKDSASQRLSSLRASIRALRGEISAKLRRILNDPSKSRWFANRNVQVKGGRYVLAVRAEKASALHGIVVDSSSTGRTLYVEPSSVVGLNNRLSLLLDEEKREEERILKRLTLVVGRHAGALLENQRILAELDLVFGKVRFMEEMEASIPGVGTERRLTLVKARHPLLYKIKGRDTVPMDLDLGRGITTLIITGPNTGGKTVALKTAGLLTLMALSGIPVTASPDSYFFAFSRVLADVGDEQSIESSLSTFSSHIERVKLILEEAGPDSLVLIDELGTGTDPEEGSALAVAIAEYLHKKGSINIITTHHGELKLLAHGTPGMENASVEFDVDSLKPTYRLLVGVPGESNAFVIAERLGLLREVVERAREIKGDAASGRGELVRWLLEAKKEAGRLMEEAKRAKEEAERELETARREAERIREEALEEAERIVEEAASRVRGAERSGPHAVVRVAREVKRRIAEKAAEKVAESLEVGCVVEIPSFGLEGKVVAVKGKSVEVDTGKMRITVPMASVRPTGRKEEVEEEAPKEISVSIERPRETFFPELHLRGMTVDEAIPELERFINDGYLLGIKSLRVVHGKGEGILKRAVHQHLKGHPLVANYFLADEREGGSGVTVVELNL